MMGAEQACRRAGRSAISIAEPHRENQCLTGPLRAAGEVNLRRRLAVDNLACSPHPAPQPGPTTPNQRRHKPPLDRRPRAVIAKTSTDAARRLLTTTQ